VLSVAADGLIDSDAAARFIGETPKNLERLVRLGVIPRKSGRFNPIQLVHGYINHIKSESSRKNNRPLQTEIAAHLDMSERNARDVLKRLEIDHKESPLDEIRIKYIRYLRELAAGRGGDKQADLTESKIRQAEADARLKELAYFEKIEMLVDAEWVSEQIANHATVTRTEVENSIEQIVAAIESEHGVTVERTKIEKALSAASRAVCTYPTFVAAEVADGTEAGLDQA